MNVLFVGYGRMGSAIGESWLSNGLVDQVLAIDPNLPTVTAQCFRQTSELPAVEVHLVVIAVKPGYVSEALKSLPAQLLAKAIVVSVAAGVTLATLRAGAPECVALVRGMPNTPVMVNAGCTALFSSDATASVRERLSQLFGAVGNAYWVEKEADLDIVTAISGSGPAYFHLFCEALSNAAVSLGLNDALARQLVCDTAWGAARLQQQPQARFESLREVVTSPNGTTAAAISTFEQAQGLRPLTERAVRAAWQRSQELSAT